MEDAKVLAKSGEYEEAYYKADHARGIFELRLGEQAREVADALH